MLLPWAIGLFAVAAEVGIYSIAVAVAGLIWVVAEAFGLAAFARGGTESAEALQMRDRRLVRLNAVLSLGAAVVIGILATTVLERVLPAYAASVPLLLVLTGGILYSLGALVYALKRPDPFPRWFGFHEIFHVLTIAAFACQYIAVFAVVTAAARGAGDRRTARPENSHSGRSEDASLQLGAHARIIPGSR